MKISIVALVVALNVGLGGNASEEHSKIAMEKVSVEQVSSVEVAPMLSYEIIMKAVELDFGGYLLTDGQGAFEYIIGMDIVEGMNYKVIYEKGNWDNILSIEGTHEDLGLGSEMTEEYLMEEKEFYQNKFMQYL